MRSSIQSRSSPLKQLESKSMDSSQGCFVDVPVSWGKVLSRYVASATVDYEAGGGW